jgi:Flp pilus assembly protein TadG
MKKLFRFHFLREEGGASLVELAFVLPLFPLLLFGAIDFARAFYISVELAGAAQGAALYGSANPTDVTGMQSVAQDDAPNVPNLSVSTPTTGCECPDGTLYSQNCTAPPTTCTGGVFYVNRVNVTVTGTYSPLIPWPGVPSSMTLTSSASMRSGGA